MNDIPNTFNKTIVSPNSIRILYALILPALILILIYFFTKEDAFFILSSGFLIVVFFKTINYLNEPNQITITEDSIKLDNKVIDWTNIEKINFNFPCTNFSDETPTGGGVLLYIMVPVQEIEISTKLHAVTKIYPRLYKDCKVLRSKLELFAKAKGIKVFVEDRGA